MSAEATTVDLIFAAVALLSVTVGLVRGLVLEAMALAGWFVAFAAAAFLLPMALPYVPVGESGGAVHHASTFVVCYLAALLAWSLLARLLRALVRKSVLSWPDRLLGAVFGLVRAVLLAMVATVFVLMTPLATSEAWQRSWLAPGVVNLVKGVRPMLPQGLQRWLPD